MPCQTYNTPMVLFYADGSGSVFSGTNYRIVSFSSTGGFNNSESSLTVNVVIDGCYNPGGVNLNTGYPVIFQAGNFNFGGIISNIEYSESESGLKYVVNIRDPRKLLDLVKLLLSGYYCNLEAANFINVLKLIETGAAGAACAGVTMPGAQLPSIGNCASFGTSSNGAGRGVSYYQIALALSSYNPAIYTTAGVPLYVNMGPIVSAAASVPYATADGSNMSLGDFISSVCDEAGFDYVVTLSGTTINFDLIDRTGPPSFGNISGMIAAARSGGRLISATEGIEETYEPTNKVIIGDNVHYLKTPYARGTTAMFLGYLPNGDPVKVYSPAQLVNGVTINTETLSAALSATGCSFPSTYTIKEAELLCCGNIKTWKTYCLTHPGSIGYTVGNIISPTAWGSAATAAFQAISAIAGGTDPAKQINTVSAALTKTLNVILEEIVFKWIQQFYNEYYGKQWLINIGSPICANPAPPVGVQYIKGDAGQYRTSDVPTDAGWPDSGNILGLNMFTADTALFESDDGRLGGFIQIPVNESRTLGSNTFRLNSSLMSGQVYQKGSSFYVEARSIDGLMFRGPGNNVEVLVTTPFIPLSIVPPQDNIAAGFKAISIIAGQSVSSIVNNYNGQTQGSLNPAELNEFIDLPIAGGFDYACIPMKSNMYIYGPWTGSSGAVGGTTVEEIRELNPWTYGGLSNMSTIGLALASNGLRTMNRAESGSVTVAESPAYSLGPVLSLGGAVLNSIVVEYGASGVSTKYDFKTFTPKFGNYAKALADRTKQVLSLKKEIYKGVKEFRQKTITAITEARKAVGKASQNNFLEKRVIQDSTSSTASSTLQMLLYNSYPLQDDLNGGAGAGGGGGATGNAPLNRLSCQEICDYDPDPLSPSTGNGITSRNIFNEAGLDKRSAVAHALDDDRYAKYAITSLDSLLSPVSLNGSGGLSRMFGNSNGWEWSNPKLSMPPVVGDGGAMNGILPITREFLNPMLSSMLLGGWDGREGATNSGFTITHIAYGTDFTKLFTENDEKQLQTDFRFSALKGPLVLQSWGYDINGKPIPNVVDSPSSCENGNFQHSGLKDEFLGNWISNPKTWPVGPIDLRWDRERGVWVAPQPERIVVAQLLEDLNPYSAALAFLLNPNTSRGLFYNDYNVYGPNGEPLLSNVYGTKITVVDFLDRKLCKGTRIYAYHYGEGNYLALEASVVNEETCDCSTCTTSTTTSTTTTTTTTTTQTTTTTTTTPTTTTTTPTTTATTTMTTETVTTTPCDDYCGLGECFAQFGGAGVMYFDGSCITFLPTTSCSG